MNDEELRRRLSALFAEYGGPMESFVDRFNCWAGVEKVDVEAVLRALRANEMRRLRESD